MKKQSLLISIMLLLKLSVFANDSGFYALFSPVQGEQAFEKIYKMIETATEEVSLTIYSWSDKNVVDAINKALENGAQVRVVLHKPLYNKSRVKAYILKNCPWSKRSIRLLDSFSIPYEAILIENDQDFQKVNSMSNHNTFPQIFLDDSFFGGYDELSKQAKNDYLNSFK